MYRKWLPCVSDFFESARCNVIVFLLSSLSSVNTLGFEHITCCVSVPDAAEVSISNYTQAAPFSNQEGLHSDLWGDFFRDCWDNMMHWHSWTMLGCLLVPYGLNLVCLRRHSAEVKGWAMKLDFQDFQVVITSISVFCHWQMLHLCGEVSHFVQLLPFTRCFGKEMLYSDGTS